MSFYNKIKTIAETMTNYTVIVDTSNGANIEFDNMVFPSILILIQQEGTYNTANSHYRDSANVKIVLFNKIPQDFNNSDVDTIKDSLKDDLIRLQHKIRYNFDFKINAIDLKYSIVYDEYDANLIGVVMNDVITERVGLNLACFNTPQLQQFTVDIKDQDGNIIETFTSSGEYFITLFSGVSDTITNNITTILDDII